MDTITPIGRTTDDVLALHQILLGPDELDPTSLDHDWDLVTQLRSRATVGTILSSQPMFLTTLGCNKNGVTALQSAGVQTTQVSLESLTQARQAAPIIGAAEFREPSQI